MLAAALFVVVALSGCGGSAEDPGLTAEPVDLATDSSTPTATQAPRSDRGNLIKQVGEPAGNRVAEGSDEWALKFTVTGIEVDPQCTAEYAVPAVNGHLVAISIEATTGPEPKFSEILYNGVTFDANRWKAIASNGTTVNSITSNATYSCLEQAESLPMHIGAAEKVTGKVILDVPDAAGTLVYSDYGSTGWEWAYGAK